MKIGILTFHRANNYGAFLQCYSLLKRIREDFSDASVEVIDYESKNMYNYYRTDLVSLMFGRSSRTSRLTLRNRLSKAKTLCIKMKQDRLYVKKIKVRNKNFEEALSRLTMSTDRLVSDDYDSVIKFINKQKYDLIIAGSDAIWNDSQTSTPNVFYLGKDINAKFVSYAASSFGMNYLKKSQEELRNIAEAVKCYQYIGVRDQATEDYVKLFNVNVPIVHTCDPSIFLNLESKEFNIERIVDMLKKNGIDFSKPIFGIMGGDWLGAIARQLIGDDVQLIAVYEPNKYANSYLYDLTPFEWARVFSLFKLTFTHFFHGTLFSLKNGTPTMSIEWENDYSSKFDTKILDVLKRLDLVDYRFTKREAETDEKMLKSHFDKVMGNLELEKERIRKGLDKERKSYDAFLYNVKDIIGGIYEQ